MFKNAALFATLLLVTPSLPLAQSVYVPSRGDNERYVLPVYPVSSDSFEVVMADPASPAAMWCAAAKYVDRYIPGDVRQIWVSKALSGSVNEPRRKSMVFSVQPTATESRSITFGLRTEGLTKTMAAADSVCFSSDFTVVLQVK